MNPGNNNPDWKNIAALLNKLESDYPGNETIESLSKELHSFTSETNITRRPLSGITGEIRSTISEILKIDNLASIELDENYTIQKANDNAARIMRADHRQLLHKNIIDFILPEYRKIFTTQAELLLKNGTPESIRVDLNDTTGKLHNVFFYGTTKLNGNHKSMLFQFVDFDVLLFNFFPGMAKKKDIFGSSISESKSLVYELDTEGRFININKTFEETLGYRASELIGHEYTEFIHPDEITGQLNEYSDIRSHGNLSIKNYRIRHKSGAWINFNCTSFLTTGKNGQKSLVIISDSILKGLESSGELKKKKLIQDIIFNHLPGMDVYLIDNDMRFLYAAGKEKNRYRLSDEDFIGKSIHEVLQPRTRKTLIPLYRRALNGQAFKKEVRYSSQVFELWLSPVKNQSGEVLGAVIVSKNITTEKANRNQLRKAKQEAEAADKAKSLFLASMSHEIRTPLNTIIGFANQLRKTGLNSNQNKYVKLIQDSSDQLINVVNELLILFKIGMGKVFIDKAPFSIREMFDEINEIFEPEAARKSLSYSCKVSPKVPELVTGDLFRVKQVLINLVSNAIKYTDNGYVKINCRVTEDKKRKIYLAFIVKDSGIGIPEEELPYIFDEFRQARNLESKKRDGTGLGLTITKKLVELQKGKITLKSSLNKGTSFTITIPFQKTKAKGTLKKIGIYEMKKKLLAGKRLLLVDDDEQNLILADVLFKEWEMKFDITADAENGIELSRINKYDIILLDIHMPKISGMELMQMIRGDSRNLNQDTIIMTITANILQSDLKKYLSGGFNGYILKPFREEELYNKICSMLQIKTAGEKVKIDSDENFRDKGNEKRTFPAEYDLAELIATAKGDQKFINRTVKSFTENAQKGSSQMKAGLKNEDWKIIGETAHRLITGFRYFKCKEIVNNLIEIENLTLHEHKYEGVTGIVNETLPLIEKTLENINKEFT